MKRISFIVAVLSLVLGTMSASAANFPFNKSECVYLCKSGEGIEVYATKALQSKLRLTGSDILLTKNGIFITARCSRQQFMYAKFYQDDILLIQACPERLGPDKLIVEFPAPFERKCNRVLLY